MRGTMHRGYGFGNNWRRLLFKNKRVRRCLHVDTSMGTIGTACCLGCGRSRSNAGLVLEAASRRAVVNCCWAVRNRGCGGTGRTNTGVVGAFCLLLLGQGLEIFDCFSIPS